MRGQGCEVDGGALDGTADRGCAPERELRLVLVRRRPLPSAVEA
ncbi:hypothetical protein [Streptomyces sp. NPDC047014]